MLHLRLIFLNWKKLTIKVGGFANTTFATIQFIDAINGLNYDLRNSKMISVNEKAEIKEFEEILKRNINFNNILMPSMKMLEDGYFDLDIENNQREESYASNLIMLAKVIKKKAIKLKANIILTEKYMDEY